MLSLKISGVCYPKFELFHFESFRAQRQRDAFIVPPCSSALRRSSFNMSSCTLWRRECFQEIANFERLSSISKPDVDSHSNSTSVQCDLLYTHPLSEIIQL